MSNGTKGAALSAVRAILDTPDERKKCGECLFAGWGPGMARRCRHPRRACFAPWVAPARPCPTFAEWPGVPGKHPQPVGLAVHCERWAEARHLSPAARGLCAACGEPIAAHPVAGCRDPREGTA